MNNRKEGANHKRCLSRHDLPYGDKGEKKETKKLENRAKGR